MQGMYDDIPIQKPIGATQAEPQFRPTFQMPGKRMQKKIYARARFKETFESA